MSHEISRSTRIRETSKLVMVSIIINKNIYFSIPSILSFSQKPIMDYSLELSPEVGFQFWLKNNTYPIFYLRWFHRVCGPFFDRCTKIMASGDGEYECSILFLIIFLFTIVSSLTSCFYCFKCFSKQGSPWRRKHFLRKIIWRFHVSLILPYLVHLLGVSNKYSFLDNVINFILKMNAFISLMLVTGVLIPLLSLFSWQFLSLGFLDNSLTLFGPLVPVSP